MIRFKRRNTSQWIGINVVIMCFAWRHGVNNFATVGAPYAIDCLTNIEALTVFCSVIKHAGTSRVSPYTS